MKLTTKHGEIDVSVAAVARMADRMYRFHVEGRRASYVAKAKKRVEAGPARNADAAIIIAAGG